jgi:hypothetical protein
MAYNASTIASCCTMCASEFYSLAIITPDWLCGCSMSLPGDADRWSDANSTAQADDGDNAWGAPAAVYCLHAGELKFRIGGPGQSSGRLMNWYCACLLGTGVRLSKTTWPFLRRPCHACHACLCCRAASNSSQCRLSNLGFNKDSWTIAYSPE